MKLRAEIITILALTISTGSLAIETNTVKKQADNRTTEDTNQWAEKKHRYYDRVDLSFSKFPVDTDLLKIKDKLSDISCGIYEADCEAKDSEGNQLYFWGARPEDDETKVDYFLTIKTVTAAEFEGRSISALGIGKARKKPTVIKNVEKFLPGLEINCDRRASGNVGPVECGASIDPGWFQIGFDEKGNLLKIRFDAYKFT